MTLEEAVAELLGEAPAGDLRHWLAGRGLGLVPVADAAAFAWAGPWIGRLADGACAVRFGVPSGTIAGPAGEPVEGWVLAPLDVAGWTPPPAREPGRGVVEALLVAAAAEARMERRDRVEVEAGRGIVGDRYHAAAGTFGAGTPLTLVAAEVLQELGIGDEHRRSVVTRGVDLGALVGREFAVGELRCRGLRLCEPCAHLDRLAGGGLLRPLVHRGGLRADALSGGTIATGDRVQAL